MISPSSPTKTLAVQEIPSKIEHIHLIAICGTGMGSLAGLLKEKGYKITGSDHNIYPPMSTQLESLGIPLFEGYHPKNLKQKPDLVVVGNAVSKINPEVQELIRLKIPYISMPEAISHFFIRDKKTIMVAGTHGKTTTSAIIAHLLLELKSDPSYLFGGVSKEGNQNYRNGNGPYFVIEGDEYDTAFFDKESKFLHYKPFYTILTSLEFDHADIYRDIKHFTSSFEKLMDRIDPKGFILACSLYPKLIEILPQSRAPHETYGMDKEADWFAADLKFDADQTTFDIYYRGNKEFRLSSPLAGNHNVLNVLSSFALLRKLGINADKFQEALLTFKGIKRRQEVRASINGVIVIDDFAHHPTAVLETVDAIKKRYPQHHLWAVFEPRSNTSKRDIFQEQYSNAFKRADSAIIADVFMPEKVKDGKILNVEKLAAEITKKGTPAKHISGVDTIISHLTSQTKAPAVILIMSNGGFGGIHEKLIQSLKR